MHHRLFLLFAVLFFTSAAQAQSHRWHDLTPDSLRGTTFNSVALAYDGDTRVLFATYERGVLKSIDSGASWQHMLKGHPIRHLTVPVEHPNLVYAISPGTLYKSTDGGASWTNLSPVIAQTFPNMSLGGFTRVELSPDDTARVVVARSQIDGRLILSEDGGQTFYEVGWGGALHGVEVNVAPSQVTPGRLYAHVYLSGSTQIEFRRVVLDDWGHTVTRVTLTDTEPEITSGLTRFLIDDTDRLYTGSWVSTDGGETWERTAEEGGYIIYAVSGKQPIAYALKRIGEWPNLSYAHFASFDHGVSWTPLETEETGWDGVTTVDARDSTLFTASPYGIYAYARSGTVGTATEEQPSPSALGLRAYPNPSRGRISIEVEPSGPVVSAEIFDVTGRRVAVLAETVPGQLVWADEAAPGLYLLRVVVGDHVLTRVLTRL